MNNNYTNYACEQFKQIKDNVCFTSKNRQYSSTKASSKQKSLFLSKCIVRCYN